jgi:hypothetical protein
MSASVIKCYRFNSILRASHPQVPIPSCASREFTYQKHMALCAGCSVDSTFLNWPQFSKSRFIHLQLGYSSPLTCAVRNKFFNQPPVQARRKFKHLSYITLCGGLSGTFQCLDHICIFPLSENSTVRVSQNCPPSAD